MKKTLGGDRLGTGKKIKVDLSGYGRSTFDQTRQWKSTMAPGVLVPCFKEIGTNGTTFDIDIRSLAHTIPTIAPLFGSFKLQIDMFACPIRLYQGLLHNNAYNIGLNMDKVLMPRWKTGTDEPSDFDLFPLKAIKANPSSLASFLGTKSYKPEKSNNATFMLAYYDIFKNYFSNKQEKNAKVIAPSIEIERYILENTKAKIDNEEYNLIDEEEYYTIDPQQLNTTWYNFSFSIPKNENTKLNTSILLANGKLIYGTINTKIRNEIGTRRNQIVYAGDLIYTDGSLIRNNVKAYLIENENEVTVHIVKVNENGTISPLPETGIEFPIENITIKSIETKYKIEDFPLENIDNARRKILSKTDFMDFVELNTDINYLPYSANFNTTETLEYEEGLDLRGLVLKTYQSDIFSNWLSDETIDMINNLSSVTIDSETGTFDIDALFLAKKVYNVMNKIAVSGGSYEDWQEANYGQEAIQRAESPIYIGGASAEIMFEEVVSTAQSGDQPLATLGGKGKKLNDKGGNITYKCNEPTIILGIASITPRVDYYQNEYWFNELWNIDEIHKPGLDGIGFQDIMAPTINSLADKDLAYGKQPAWLWYQTAVDEVHGDFAKEEEEENSLYFMTLRRKFEIERIKNDNNQFVNTIKDFTAYIDPAQYNYAFANNDFKAQNFWLQIEFKVISRRVMASYELPHF